MKRRCLQILPAVLALTTLLGCADKADKLPKVANGGVTQPYPPLPADLRNPVPLPALRDGQDARSALAQNRAALKQCQAEQVDLVEFYDRLRKSRPVPKSP